MAFMGMTPEQVEAAGRALGTESGNLNLLEARVQSLVDQAARLWSGDDVRQFAQIWQSSLAPQAKASATLLQTMAMSLRVNASQQRQTSGDSNDLARHNVPVIWGDYDRAGMDVDSAPTSPLVNHNDDHPTGTSKHPEVTVDLVSLATASVVLGAAGTVKGGFGTPGGLHGDGEASYWAGLHTEGSAGATFSKDQVQVEASGMVGGGVHGEANGSFGYSVAQIQGSVEGTAGAWASGDASVGIGKNGVKGTVDVQGMAGATASANASIGIPGAQYGVGVTGYAGIGVQAHAEMEVTADSVKIDLDLGAALGIGFGVKFDVEIKPKEIVDLIASLWPPW